MKVKEKELTEMGFEPKTEQFLLIVGFYIYFASARPIICAPRNSLVLSPLTS